MALTETAPLTFDAGASATYVDAPRSEQEPEQTQPSRVWDTRLSYGKTALSEERAATETRADRTAASAPALPVRVQSRFEGVVTAVGEDDEDEFFSVRLSEIGTGVEVEAELTVDDVKPEDRGLLEVGAWVYLTVGRIHTHGRADKVSALRFRRVPAWDAADIAHIHEIARKRHALLDVDGQD